MIVDVAQPSGLPDAGPARWLYVGDDPLWRVRARQGALADLEELDVAARRATHAAALRGPFLDWIGALGERQSLPAWWATSLAAKSPYPTVLLGRIAALAAAQDVLRTAGPSDEPLLAVCATQALAFEVSRCAQAAGHEVRWHPPGGRRGVLMHAAARRGGRALAAHAPAPLLRALTHHRGLEPLLAGQAAYRRRVASAAPPSAPFTGVLLATWLDGRSFPPGGGYRDFTFGPLADALRAAGEPVALLPRVLPSLPYREALARLRASGETAYVPDALLTASDWASAEADAARFTLRIDADADVGGVPVARLAREHVDEHRRAMPDSLAYRFLAQRLASAGVRPHTLVIPYEGHAWEQLLTDGARSAWPGVRVVGYENLNFSTMALSMYPATAERGRRPLPDRIVANGETFAAVLRDQGEPAERVVVGGALRHAAGTPLPARPPTRPLRVLAATSIDAAESAELVAKAADAFAGRDGYALTIKPHPAVALAQLRGAHPDLTFDTGPLDAALAQADVLLYAYSAVAYDALAAGVPPVHVMPDVALDLDQLEPFPRLRAVARTAEQLRAAADAIAGWDDERRTTWSADAAAALAQALAPVRDDLAAVFTQLP